MLTHSCTNVFPTQDDLAGVVIHLAQDLRDVLFINHCEELTCIGRSHYLRQILSENQSCCELDNVVLLFRYLISILE